MKTSKITCDKCDAQIDEDTDELGQWELFYVVSQDTASNIRIDLCGKCAEETAWLLALAGEIDE